ncbi:DMT family transporter [Desulfurococcaceae archaeon MEX13E-LK6-19]|nr:DMT family transporter [Desulfurococcaceae archaeon MEX13E-LK6-19]
MEKVIMLNNKRMYALAGALLVTFLWSTSYVFIKIGLRELNPIAFAAYRYTIASIILMIIVLTSYKGGKSLEIKQLPVFLVLGFTGYFVAQGLQFLGLYYLPAITVTFILNMTPIFVLVLSALFLKEKPTFLQFVGIMIVICGVILFFSSSLLALNEVLGVFLTVLSGLGWASYMIISRYYLRGNKIEVLVLTSYSMSFGSLLLLGTAILGNSIMFPSVGSWFIILWLSIINTVLAFVLWNHALKVLRAYEQSILQNTMLIQITLLAYVFLGETLTLQKTLGIIVVFIGVLIVQLSPR